jgi:antitoxin (DNA-binding transcriptional repressor) of toxin-antitoxin stability system
VESAKRSCFATHGRPVHANQRARQIAERCNGILDPPCQRLEVRIDRTGHDFAVTRVSIVKTNKMSPVYRQDRAIRRYGVGEDSLIRIPLIGIEFLGTSRASTMPSCTIKLYNLSMRKSWNVSEFRGQCLALLDQLPPEGILITRRGKPIARVTPVRQNDADLIGELAGKLEIRGDILSTGAAWDAES